VIEAILPRQASVAEAREDDPALELHPEEEELVARAVERRRREFTTGRDCARRALAGLGLPSAPILSGSRGEPRWPPGVVGSITHCDGYRAAAVAHRSDLAALGIDAEPHAPLRRGLLEDIAGAAEADAVAELSRSRPSVCWDRLLFSAKESAYKAWYPLAEQPLGLLQSRIVFDPAGQGFEARPPASGPRLRGLRSPAFYGRWALDDGLLLTAVAIAPSS
jgi:4'-phosphopantetheinyl transferase EntD